ncbi:MAG: hypothetical protein C5B54_08420 [Acidobacteria bacterium]|nr:MAG: hypothetical protein C5B54_08420 [Acidobacteriota bacterium]
MDSSKIISLEDFVKQQNRYPGEEEVLQWAIQIGNLLETDAGTYPLLDYKNIYVENDTRWTTANPPVTSDASEALFRTGVVLYYLLTREHFQISYYLDGPPAVRQKNPQISVRFESIALRLLQNIRSLRYNSVSDFRSDMLRLQKELTGDWPLHWASFKGNPLRTNLIPRITLSATGKTLKEIWKARIGEIWASPVMAGESLFVGSADGNFYSVDAQTGNVIWKLNLAARVESTACINGVLAYVGTDLGNLHAVNIKNGSVKWKKSLGEYVRSSPICDENHVYVGSINPTRKTGMLWALSKDSGSVIWKKQIGPVFSSPAIEEGEIFIGSDDGNFYCISADGSEKWHINLNGKIRSTPVVVKDSVYIGSFGGILYKIQKEDGKVVWQNDQAGSIYSSPGYGRSFIAAGNNAGSVNLFFATSGKKKGEFGTGGPVTASPLIVQQSILVGSNDGKFYILDAQGALLCTFDAQAPINSSAYYRENIIYVGCDAGLLALALS